MTPITGNIVGRKSSAPEGRPQHEPADDRGAGTVCLAVRLLVAFGGSRPERSVEEWRERLLATSLIALMSFGMMLGTSLQSAAVEGFAKQPAGLLNIESEAHNARPHNEAGGQPGGSSWNPARNEPRVSADAATATSPGELVAAPVSGRVVFAAPFKSYGPLLIVAHDEYHTVLWGFAKLEVMVNDFVTEGQAVGFLGGEGATPSILHVESHRSGHLIDRRVLTEGISPEQAVDDAITQIEQILSE